MSRWRNNADRRTEACWPLGSSGAGADAAVGEPAIVAKVAAAKARTSGGPACDDDGCVVMLPVESVAVAD